MKQSYYLIFSILFVSSPAAFSSEIGSAPVVSLKGQLYCGGYKSTRSGGVTFDNSKYAIMLGQSADGIHRKGVLVKIIGDGSKSIVYEKDACQQQNENSVVCKVGKVSVKLNTAATAQGYPADFSFSWPIVSGQKSGHCTAAHNADESIQQWEIAHVD